MKIKFNFNPLHQFEYQGEGRMFDTCLTKANNTSGEVIFIQLSGVIYFNVSGKASNDILNN